MVFEQLSNHLGNMFGFTKSGGQEAPSVPQSSKDESITARPMTGQEVAEGIRRKDKQVTVAVGADASGAVTDPDKERERRKAELHPAPNPDVLPVYAARRSGIDTEKTAFPRFALRGQRLREKREQARDIEQQKAASEAQPQTTQAPEAQSQEVKAPEVQLNDEAKMALKNFETALNELQNYLKGLIPDNLAAVRTSGDKRDAHIAKANELLNSVLNDIVVLQRAGADPSPMTMIFMKAKLSESPSA
jgi:hypothetical protein